MIEFFKLAWAARKVIGIAAAALFIGYLAVSRIHAYGQHKADAARAEEHALWQADTAQRDKAAAAVILAQAQKAASDKQHNDEVESEYLAKMDKLSGERDRIVGLLQRARGQVLTLAAGQGAGAPVPAAAGPAPSPEQLDAALAAALVESRANADQLDALIAVVKPQL